MDIIIGFNLLYVGYKGETEVREDEDDEDEEGDEDEEADRVYQTRSSSPLLGPCGEIPPETFFLNRLVLLYS